MTGPGSGPLRAVGRRVGGTFSSLAIRNYRLYFIGQVVFAGNLVFAVDGNNGILAFTIVPPSRPPLTIARAGANAVLSWTSSATGFALQKTSSLSPPDWADVSQTPDVVNGQNTITNEASVGTAFYRLRKP